MTRTAITYCAEIILSIELGATDQPSALAELDELIEKCPLDLAPKEVKGVTSGDLWRQGERRPETYSTLEMEAALCVWEWINDVTLGTENQRNEAWSKLREETGSIELRHSSMALGKWCLSVYDICTEGDPDIFDGLSYDWEVIPAIMRYACNDAGPILLTQCLPDAYDVAPKVLKDLHLKQPERGVQCWREGDETSLSFFTKSAVSEEWFPAFSGVELVIDQQGAEAILRLMDVVEEQRRTLDHKVIETLFDSDLAPQISIDTDGCDPDGSFNPRFYRQRVTSTMVGETVVFETVDKHTDDAIRSSEISRDQLLVLISKPTVMRGAPGSNETVRNGFRDWAAKQNPSETTE